jgi:hypothetical protein
MNGNIFTQQFLINLEGLVRLHHQIYPEIPPQGIYFEALVEKSFKAVRIPFTKVKITTRNTPKHDLVVGDTKFSLKTETGEGTKEKSITITKLCTTERGPWEAGPLIKHALDHLSRYDYILMLRAIWERPVIHYQLVDIPVALLRMVEGVQLVTVERRKGKQSLAADIFDEDKKVFRVMFDAADGKCTIRNLQISQCQLLHTWDLQIAD